MSKLKNREKRQPLFIVRIPVENVEGMMEIENIH